MRTLIWRLALLPVLWSAAAVAQEPMETSKLQGPGTTIIGERESPIGLYITPWRNSAPDPGIDRPARLLRDAALPVDRDVFAREVEYHRALTEHLKQEGRSAP